MCEIWRGTCPLQETVGCICHSFFLGMAVVNNISRRIFLLVRDKILTRNSVNLPCWSQPVKLILLMKAVYKYIWISDWKIWLDGLLRISLYFWDWLILAPLELWICHLERIQNSHGNYIYRTVSLHILHMEFKGIQLTSESKLVSPIVVWELNKCNKQWSVGPYWLWLGRCCFRRCNRL